MIKGRLKQSFEDSQKTVAEIAAETGLSTTWVRRFFDGRADNPTVSTLIALAAATGERNPAWWVWRGQERKR